MKRKNHETAIEPETGTIADPDLRVLPHSLEAEKATLGAMLINPKLILQTQALLKPKDFYRRAHTAIWNVIIALSERQVEPDLVTVCQELQAIGEMDEAGGAAYVSSLTDGIPRSANIQYYAGIVKDLSQRRRMLQAASAVLKDGYDGKVPTHEIIDRADRAFVDLQRATDSGEFVQISSTVDEEYADLEHRTKNVGQLTGITSGFPTIDELTHGWQPGDLIVVAARPSIGKTAFTLNMAVHASRAGHQVALFSLEMRRKQLQKRLLAHLSGVPMDRILSGYLGEMDYQNLAAAMTQYSELRLAVNDRGHQTIGDVRAACRLMRSEKKLDLVIVDYFQLMAGSLDRGANRNEQLTDISRRLKTLADEISCPVVLLSQLNRAGDTRSDKRPILSDLRDTGALEQDADLVCFLHRKHHREDGVTSFIIEKQRNGPGGTVNLTIRRDTQTFEDAGLEPQQPELPAAPPPAETTPKPPRGWRGNRRSSW